MSSLVSRIYSGLASLKITIVTLSVLAVVLIYGTFYESANGTPMAQRAVYSSKWFDAILIVLFVNMVACTAKRYPYKPHQVGFLMVHCGILTILTGAMLTRNYGREGELFLEEGETRDYITSARPYLRVSVPSDGVDGFEIPVVFPAKATGAAVDDEVRIPRSPLRLHVTRYFPNAEWRTAVVESEAGGPAVHLRFTRHDESGEAWLVARDESRRAVDSPVRIEAWEASSDRIADSLLAGLDAGRQKSGRGALRLRFAGQPPAEIPLDGPMPRRVRAGAYEVRLREWFSHFVLREGKPTNATTAMTNPAVLFEIAGPKGPESHIVFAYHEMGSLLSTGSDLGYGVDADYVYEGGDGAPRVVLVRGPGTPWRIGSNFDLDTGGNATLEVGRVYSSASAHVDLTVIETLEKAAVRDELTNVGREERRPAVRVHFSGGGPPGEPQWVLYGDQHTIQAGDREVQIEFGRRQLPLGFSVRLVDFIETTYPGTTRSATYASDVVVADAAGGTGEPVPIHISMNKPLKHRGFRLFQSSYVRDGGREASVFSVSYDPGVTVVYTGFLIFIVGLVAIFYLKPLIKKAYLRSAALERT
jgi:hypothetical protein